MTKSFKMHLGLGYTIVIFFCEASLVFPGPIFQNSFFVTFKFAIIWQIGASDA